MPNKQKLITEILARLDEELATLIRAAQAAHEAATHEESKPEDSHDTRGLEASYLAGAQAGRIEELKKLVNMYKFLPLPEFKAGAPVAAGALIELELNGKRALYFLVGQGGGISVKVDGRPVQVITPQAPLGEELLGKRVGDAVEIEAQGQLREYAVVAIS